MKKVIVMLTVVFMAVSAKAQLADTKWKGAIFAPSQLPMILTFKKDTLAMTTPDGAPFETMSYTVKDDVITLKKLSGQSPCSVNGTFTVKYTLKTDKLTIIPLTDDCERRSAAWGNEPFDKVTVK